MSSLIYIPSDAVDPLLGLFSSVKLRLDHGKSPKKSDRDELSNILAVFIDQLIDDKRSIEHRLYLRDLEEHPEELRYDNDRRLSARIAEYVPSRLARKDKASKSKQVQKKASSEEEGKKGGEETDK